jgi:NAD(P) transhydrogenase subunit alpha
MLTIGIPKETADRETRVAMTPTIAKQLISKGFMINLESGAGELSNFTDKDYEAVGVKVEKRETVFKSKIVAKIKPPNKEEVTIM